MTTTDAGLFRREVVRHRADRLHGTVSLAVPVAWQAIGFLLLAALVTVVAFLASASYARTESVSGSVVLDKGVASIMPSRQGVVSALLVREGDVVRAGRPLVRVRSEEDMVEGETAPDRIRAALMEQDRRLATQGDLLLDAAGADRSRLGEQVVGLQAEIASLTEQEMDQRRLVDASAREYGEVQQVARNGFISRRDLEAREAALLQRRQQLAQLEQSVSAKRAQIAEARRTMLQTQAAAQAQAASAQSERAALVQRLAETELSRGYAIKSPIDGVVTAVTARIGQSVGGEQPLMLVVPSHARRLAELYVPTSAAGFLAKGEEVRLAVDAFPYQRFGTVPAKVEWISTAAIPRQAAAGSIPVYLLTADLDRSYVMAFGRPQPLVPGMTLTARIVTERRSLLEWLFEPLFAVRNR